MHGRRERGWRVLWTQSAVPAPAPGPYPLTTYPRAPFLLKSYGFRNKLRQLGDIRRDPPRLCRMYAGRGYKNGQRNFSSPGKGERSNACDGSHSDDGNDDDNRTKLRNPSRLIPREQFRRRSPARLILAIDMGDAWPLASRTMKQVVVSSTFQGAAETCRPSL